MNAHVLYARTRRGATIELGQVGDLEAAVRLQVALEDGLGDQFQGFAVVERDPDAAFVEDLDAALKAAKQAERARKASAG